MRVRLIGLDEVVEACDRVAQAIDAAGVKVDTIVAVARGGFMPARFLCDFLNVSRLLSIKVRHYEAGARSGGGAKVEYPLNGDIAGLNVLLVDDVNDSGRTLEAALPYLHEQAPASLHTAVLHEKTNTTCSADFKAEIIREWRWLLYPWAVVEDAGQFIRQMDPPPQTREAIAEGLKARHELTLSPQQLERVIRFSRLNIDDNATRSRP